MNKLIKKLPIPLSGIMLSLASLGNLMGHYSLISKKFCGLLSFCILILLTLKILLFPSDVMKDLNNPLTASVSPNYDMGLMILTTYIKDMFFNFAFYVWIVAVLIHIVLLIFYTKTVLLTFDITKLFPTTLIIYVGLGVGSITAPYFNLSTLGKYFFWFSFVAFIILFPILVYRVFIIKGLPKDTLPTITVFTGPASLTLSGYLNSFENKNIYIVGFLSIFSLIIYILVLMSFSYLLKLEFAPSFASFVFPMIITASAMKKTDLFLISIGKTIYLLKYVVLFQEIVAILILIYVSSKYIMYLDSKIKQPT